MNIFEKFDGIEVFLENYNLPQLIAKVTEIMNRPRN